MDESKAEVDADLQSRAYALETAKILVCQTHHDPHCVVEVARDIYLFITQRDPVLDVMASQDEDSNLIVLDLHR